MTDLLKLIQISLVKPMVYMTVSHKYATTAMYNTYANISSCRRLPQYSHTDFDRP